MKIKLLFLSVLLIAGLGFTQAQSSDMFDKLSNHKNVTTVYISKSLLKMMPEMNTGGANVKSLAGKLDQIEIYSSNDNKEAAQLMRKEISTLTKTKTYETLMKVKDNDDNITFYAEKDKSDSFKDLIMFINEPDECTIIRIQGSFTTDDIQKVMSTSNKK